MKLVFATGNLNKLNEAKQILGPEFEILSFSDLGFTGEIPEPWNTLEENALAKSRFIFKTYGIDCFSDDSGLEVEVLNGLPGVQSAYFAGPGKNSRDNLQKLLLEMQPHTLRKARFRAVVALIMEGKEYVFEGKIEGEISTAPKGEGGFGYDPVFIPEGHSLTFGELSPKVKNTLSHRARALKKMAEFLKELNPK